MKVFLRLHVIVFLSALLALLCGEMQAQEPGNVTGRVTNEETGLPVEGAQVFIPGTEFGGLTDQRGQYRLTGVPAGEQTIRVERIGYSPVQTTFFLSAGQSIVVDLEINQSAIALEGIVVTGFGTQLRQNVTGNIAQVNQNTIRQSNSISLEEALKGQATGVSVQSGSGKVGQAIRVEVRGPASVGAGNQPLYVVDGMPLWAESLGGGTEPTNPIADLNLNDIQSVEILKDASAAAIYGSRASNGVILITTKSGFEGTARLDFEFKTGWSDPTRKVDFITDNDQYREMILEAAENGGRTEEWVVARVPNFYSNDNTDWQDLTFDDEAGMDQLTVSMSGGSETTNYFMSAAYNNENAIMRRNDFERFSGRVKLDHAYSDRLTVGTNLYLARTIHNRIPWDRNFYQQMFLISQSPTTPPYDPETGEINTNTLYENPLLADFDLDQTRIWHSISNAQLQLNLTEELSFRSRIGIDVINQGEEQYETRLHTTAGEGSYRTVSMLNWTSDNYLNYRPDFGEVHGLEAVVGWSYQKATVDASSLSGRGFPTDQFRRIESAAEITGASTSGTGSAFLSYFARANYQYDSRYLLSLSSRIDGSSRFGADNRYGFFPAASVGWLASNEDFFQSDWISFLKLRASYGLTGNAQIDDFASRGLFEGGNYVGQPGIRPTQLRNPDLKWETTAQFDLGMNVGLFDDRISVEADVYQRNTRDMLLPVNIPGSSGFQTVTQNLGKMRNRGFELTVDSKNMVGSFQWGTLLGFALNRNLVTDLDGQVITTGEGSGAYRRPNVAMEGHPLGVFYAVKYAGVDPQNGDALFYKRAGSDETTANFGEAERQIIGSPHPDFELRFTNRMAWSDISLDFTFRWVPGREVFGGGGVFYEVNQQWFDPQIASQLTRWQKPGDITMVPQARIYQTNGSQISSRYLKDASYLRLQSVNLSYDIPINLMRGISGSVRSAQIYVQATNLLTFTDYELWDPEVDTTTNQNVSRGNDFYTPPQPRTIAIGFRLGI